MGLGFAISQPVFAYYGGYHGFAYHGGLGYHRGFGYHGFGYHTGFPGGFGFPGGSRDTYYQSSE
jgi:hypothetical protein